MWNAIIAAPFLNAHHSSHSLESTELAADSQWLDPSGQGHAAGSLSHARHMEPSRRGTPLAINERLTT